MKTSTSYFARRSDRPLMTQRNGHRKRKVVEVPWLRGLMHLSAVLAAPAPALASGLSNCPWIWTTTRTKTSSTMNSILQGMMKVLKIKKGITSYKIILLLVQQYLYIYTYCSTVH